MVFPILVILVSIFSIVEVESFPVYVHWPRQHTELRSVDKQQIREEWQEKIRYRGRIAYDGTSYKGWQVQSKGRTVQGELENTLSQRFNRTVKIVGAGRTDAGVHATNQAFQFDLFPEEIKIKVANSGSKLEEKNKHEAEVGSPHKNEEFCRQLQYSLNSMLREDMRVWNICKAPPPALVTMPDGMEKTFRWHVIYDSVKKLYTYRLSIEPEAITYDPLERFTRVHTEGNVDRQKLERVLKHFEGTHDFRAFAGAIEANQRKKGIEKKDTFRTVYSVDLISEGSGKYRIEILLKGALYKMVRNMVGTALEVSKGRMEEERMLQMLHHDDCENGKNQFVRKDNKCKPAHPEGLTLERVFYDDSVNF